MKVIETSVKKIIADENKVIIPKEIQYDENGNEIPRSGAKVIYLAINDSEDNYMEIEDVEDNEEPIEE